VVDYAWNRIEADAAAPDNIARSSELDDREEPNGRATETARFTRNR
jgi:hypothetical protein